VTAATSSRCSRVAPTPADLVMLCGVLGNLTDADVRATVATVRSLAAPDALVVWTRGRCAERDTEEPTDSVRQWFGEEGFEEVLLDRPAETGYRVGAHRLVADPRPLGEDRRFFAFAR